MIVKMSVGEWEQLTVHAIFSLAGLSHRAVVRAVTVRWIEWIERYPFPALTTPEPGDSH